MNCSIAALRYEMSHCTGGTTGALLAAILFERTAPASATIKVMHIAVAKGHLKQVQFIGV